MSASIGRSAAVALLALFLVASASPAALTLVKDGKPTAVIITSDNPVPSQQLAAQELQYHIKEMSGAKLEILKEGELGSFYEDGVIFWSDNPKARGKEFIFVGQTLLMKRKIPDYAGLPKETLVVKTYGNVLFLAGEDGSTKDQFKEPYDSSANRTGTLFAVYDFLEDQLGCHWLWPGKTGECIPQRKTIEVGDLNIRETPKLFRRHFRSGYAVGAATERAIDYTPRYYKEYAAIWDQQKLEERQWFKRMRFGQSDGFAYGHAFTDWLDRFGKTQPELLALQADGHRGLPNVAYDPKFVKLCISNPKVIDVIIDDFKAARAKDPTFRFLNACENDGSLGFCRCSECAKWDKPLNPELEKHYADMGWTPEQIKETFGPSPRDGLPGSLSNRYFTFFNALARKAREVTPDAWVVVYAYSRYRFAPIDLKLEPNLFIGLIGFDFYPMTAMQQAAERKTFMDWRAAGAMQMFNRPNSFYYSIAHGIPWDASHQMGEDLKLMINNGIVATDYDSLNGHWSTAAPTYYVVARLHWDTDASIDSLLNEFDGAFGPGAAEVKEYFAHWEKVFQRGYARPDLNEVVKTVNKDGGRVAPFKFAGVALTEDDFDAAAAMLAKARAQMEGKAEPRQLEKLHVLDLGLEHGKLMWRLCKIANLTSQDDDVYFDDRWPLIQRVFEIRDELGRLGAHDTLWLTYFEVYFQDMYGTRVYQDFFNRKVLGYAYFPVMTPAENKWAFMPDPEDKGEAEGWVKKLPAAPDYMKRGTGDRLFHRTWDKYNPVIKWMDATKNTKVGNGWYQVNFDASSGIFTPYIPCIVGKSAKIWMNDELVREVTEKEIAAGEPIMIDLPTLKSVFSKYRLTIKVTSTEKAGGLIGPAYVVRRVENQRDIP